MPTPTAVESVSKETQLREYIGKTLAACTPLITPAMAERLHTVVWQQFRHNEKLQRCTLESIYTSVHHMAQLNLDPSLPNEAWLVPYGTEATLIIGYGGLRKMALQDPAVLDIAAMEVHEHDEYENYGPLKAPLHRFPPRFQPRGRTQGYYGLLTYRSGAVRCLELSLDDVKAHRKRYSRAGDSQFWQETTYTKDGTVERKGSFDAMALKTVLRQLCNAKYVSLSPIAAAVLQRETAALEGPPLGGLNAVTRAGEQAKDVIQHMIDVHGGTRETYERPPVARPFPEGAGAPANPEHWTDTLARLDLSLPHDAFLEARRRFNWAMKHPQQTSPEQGAALVAEARALHAQVEAATQGEGMRSPASSAEELAITLGGPVRDPVTGDIILFPEPEPPPHEDKTP